MVWSIDSYPPMPNGHASRMERRWAPKVGEKITSNRSAITRQWFLPWVESLVGETAEMKRVYRRMVKHPVIKSALYTKVLAVASLERQVNPPDGNSPRDREAVKFIEHNMERLPEGFVMATVETLQHKLIDGWQLSEKVWGIENRGQYEGKIVLDRLAPKDPEDIRIEIDRFNNVSGFADATQPDQWFPKRDFVYSRYMPMYDNPYGLSDFRAAYGPYWMEDTVTKLRVMGQEKNVSGVLIGEYTDDGGDSQSSLEEALENIRTGTWASIPEGTRVYALDLALGSDANYKSFIDDQQKQMLIAIAGAYLQTLEGQIQDARGDTKVQKSIVELFQWLLAWQIQEIWNRQIIPDLIDFNYPGCGYPKLTLGGVNEKDLQDRLQTLQGANQLVGLSKKAVYTDLSIQRPDPNDPDDLIPPSGGQQPFGGPMGGGMLPPGGGGLPFSERRNGGVPPPADGGVMPKAEVERFAEEDWEGPHQGERGGTYWWNRKTGGIEYSRTNPGLASSEQGETKPNSPDQPELVKLKDLKPLGEKASAGLEKKEAASVKSALRSIFEAASTRSNEDDDPNAKIRSKFAEWSQDEDGFAREMVDYGLSAAKPPGLAKFERWFYNQRPVEDDNPGLISQRWESLVGTKAPVAPQQDGMVDVTGWEDLVIETNDRLDIDLGKRVHAKLFRPVPKFSEQDWEGPIKGQRGGTLWRNRKSGEIEYSQSNPGAPGGAGGSTDGQEEPRGEKEATTALVTSSSDDRRAGVEQVNAAWGEASSSLPGQTRSEVAGRLGQLARATDEGQVKGWLRSFADWLISFPAEVIRTTVDGIVEMSKRLLRVGAGVAIHLGGIALAGAAIVGYGAMGASNPAIAALGAWPAAHVLKSMVTSISGYGQRVAAGKRFSEFAEVPAGEMSLPGAEGRKAMLLLANANRRGQLTLEAITRRAVKRIIDRGANAIGVSLFDMDELKALASAIGAANATADLLGRTRVRERMQQGDIARMGLRTFAEEECFQCFADPSLPAAPMEPNRALEWFKAMVPEVNPGPGFAPGIERNAFTLAVDADRVVLGRVKEVIENFLRTGQGSARDVQQVLDEAGVSTRNPSYSELVFRTNVMSAYNRGQQEELAQPGVKEYFPAWEYLNPSDSRSRPLHAERNGRLYPNSVTFDQIRGTDIKDVAQCRCGMRPISRYEMDDLLAEGRVIEEVW